ncbi:hypothetical protein F7U66_01845 [Vibrio parahaemolyticus]|nr:hypothetical protein [Vibrio parahaemolyticus]
MFVSQQCGRNFFLVKASSDLLSDMEPMTLKLDNRTKTVIYSKRAGGVLGSKSTQMPFDYGSATQDVIDSSFVDGSELAVFPCHLLDGGYLVLGYWEGYTIREYDKPVTSSGFLVYHMDSLQVVDVAKNLSEQISKVDAHPRYQSVYAEVEKLLEDEALVGRSLWSLMPEVNLFDFKGDGFSMQFACSNPESAKKLLQSRYEDLEVEYVCND